MAILAGLSRSFYTGVIGSGGLRRSSTARLADHSNRTVGMLAAAATAALIIPLVLVLRPLLRPASGEV